MANIGDNMSQTIPAVGASGTQYATDIDAFLTEVKVRLTSLVPRSSLSPGALDLANNSLQNAQYVGLFTQSSLPTTPVGSLQTFGGDLYWVTNTGQAKITAGNAINAAALAGITGDYGGANPAQFRFVDVDQEYYAYDDFAGGAWARLWAKNFDLAAGATAANRVRMAYGGGGSYTMTLPTALPGATKIVQMSSAGQLTTNGIINPDRTMQFTLAGGQGAIAGSTTGFGVTSITAGGTAYLPLIGVLNTQEQLQSIRIYYTEAGGGTASVVTLGKTSTTAATSVFSPIAGATGTLTNSGVSASILLTPNTPAILQSGDTYWIKIVCGTVSNTDLYSAVVSVSVP